MTKLTRACAASLMLLLISSFIGIFQDTAYGQRLSPSKKKAKPPSRHKSVAPSKSLSNRKPVAHRNSSSRSNASRTTAKSSGRKGRHSARALARRRAHARYLARLRVIRARDAALRNIAAANILRDVTQGEDLEVRRIAIQALGGRSGTIVVMDPNTGRILTIVNQRMALSSPVKPCSTVKLIVGLGGLHEGILNPNQTVQLARNGWGMNLTEALARSNNPFFQVLGRQLGYERVMEYATNFGFGEKTGVNYEGESPGFLPEEGEEETGHMSSHGDGFGVTAIQLAAFTSAIANGGNLYVPRVARTHEEAADFKPEVRRKIDISPEDRSRILAGMIGAVNFGTAKLAYDPVGQVAGKTGTCTGKSDRLGLFTSFSSVDNPKLVVTVITTGSTEAGKRAAEIAGRVYRAISPTFLREPIITPASASIEIPRRTINGGSN